MTTRKILVLLLLHQRKMTSDIYKRMDGYVLHVERAIHVFVLKKLLWKSHWSKEPNICLKKNAATPATSQWITTSMPKNWTLRLICRTCKQNHLTGINKYNVKKKTQRTKHQYRALLWVKKKIRNLSNVFKLMEN